MILPYLVILYLSKLFKYSTYYFFILSFIGLLSVTSKGYNNGVKPGGIKTNLTILLYVYSYFIIFL